MRGDGVEAGRSPEYYRGGDHATWLVKVHDFHFGTLYCSSDEAYSEKEAPKPLVAVTENEVPRLQRVLLRQAVEEIHARD